MTFSAVFIVNFEQISHIFFGVPILEFEQVNASWGSTRTVLVGIILLSLLMILKRYLGIWLSKQSLSKKFVQN